jgi:hypothetical protein
MRHLEDESRVMSIAEHDLVAGIRTAIRAGCRYFDAGHVGIIKRLITLNEHLTRHERLFPPLKVTYISA